MAAHKYWRLQSLATGAYLNIATLEMRGVSGGSTLCVGGTATASGSYSPTTVASKAFDTDPATYWEAPPASPMWIQYEFPSPVDIVEYSIKNGPFAGEAPIHWQMLYSDDNVTWTVAAIDRDNLSWAAGETRVFPIDSGGATGKRYWRLNVNESNSASYVLVAEFLLRTAAGGASVATGGKGSSSSYGAGNLSSYAFDGNTSTFWETLGGAPQWLRYRLPAEATIVEYVVRTGPYPQEAPKSWTLEHSGDGVNWTVAHTVTNQIAWTGNEARTFTAAAAAPPSRPRVFVCT